MNFQYFLIIVRIIYEKPYFKISSVNMYKEFKILSNINGNTTFIIRQFQVHIYK